jgi:hypothetical protein
MARALLVTGATGKQGGSLINALLEANADSEIFALTRNANSASAQKLKAKSPNIKLVTGDLDAIDSVFEKAKEASKLPIWGVFSVQVGVLVRVFTAFANESFQGSNRRWSECGKRREARQGPGRCGHQEQCQELRIFFSGPRRSPIRQRRYERPALREQISCGAASFQQNRRRWNGLDGSPSRCILRESGTWLRGKGVCDKLGIVFETRLATTANRH